MTHLLSIIALTVTLFVSFTASKINAATVQIRASGTITSIVETEIGDISNDFSVGEAASFAILSEDNGIDINPNPNSGRYSNSISFIGAVFGSYQITANEGQLTINNDVGSINLVDTIQFNLTNFTSDGVVNGLDFLGLSFALIYEPSLFSDTSLSNLSSPALDTATPNQVTWQLSFRDAADFRVGIVNVAFDSVTFTAVPIPAAAWLFGAALAGMLMLREKANMG